MTAAYLAPGSIWGQRALLAAGQSFAAMKQSEAATVVYRKLLDQTDADPELARQARQALAAQGSSPSAPRP